MTPLEHALWYASRGWRVIPIPPGYKYPRGIDAWETKATTDRDRITRYWAKHPDHGIGIATGPESGIFIVDIDPDDGGRDSLAALEAEHGPLPDTVMAITGNNGDHYVFNWPQDGEIRNSASGVLGIGIDVRGIGGQFVVAPTIHPATGWAYRWEVEHDPMDGIAVADAPPWLLDKLQAGPTGDTPRSVRIERSDLSDLPGDRWAASTTWAAELQADGASLHSHHTDSTGCYYEMWTRPGKRPEDGASASLYYKGSDVLKVFTPNWPDLDAEQTYTLWGYHVFTKHGGDFEEAARSHGRQHRRDDPVTVTVDNAPVDGRRPRPAIVHNGRQLDELTGEAIDALVMANDPPTMFVRAGQLTRLRQDESARPLIETLRTDHVRSILAGAANWYRANKDGEYSSTSPPLDVATSILATGHWPFPALAGVVELPVLRPDGTFHTAHGYDRGTRLYHWHDGDPYPAIADQPTPADVAEAVALVDELLCDFPWDTTSDRANAWGLLITPLIRAIVGQVPMALIDAPEPGTGKGLLVKACSIITTGHAAALMAWPTSDEELEKKVSATLMAGNTVVVFDNVEGMIKSPTLAAVLTADSWQGRVLGRSEVVTVPNRATWAATGNNIDVGGDLARRCYRIRLDARQAQPWKRSGFRHPDLEGWATVNRPRILHALCTIVRSWWTAGQPQATNLAAMGGYSGWVRTVGGILDHVGVPDFLANLAEFHASADREAQSWEAFLAMWADTIGEQSMTVGELVAKMSDAQFGYFLREVLPEDLAGYWDTTGFTRRLSLALRKRTGRHYGPDGLHLIEMPRDRRQVAIYSVTTNSRATPAPEQLPENMAINSRNSRALENATDSDADHQEWSNSRATPAVHLPAVMYPSAGSAGSCGGPTRDEKLSTDYPQGADEKKGSAGPEQLPHSLHSRALDDDDLF